MSWAALLLNWDVISPWGCRSAIVRHRPTSATRPIHSTPGHWRGNPLHSANTCSSWTFCVAYKYWLGLTMDEHSPVRLHSDAELIPSIQQTQELRLTVPLVIWRAWQAKTINTGVMERGGRLRILTWSSFCCRYHGFEDANYPLPNDAEEVGRLDKVQFVISSYFGGSIVAPISSKPTQIGASSFFAKRLTW